MGAYTFRRARERLKVKKEQQETFTFEELNGKTVPQIKEILDSNDIEYKSNETKKELMAYLVDVPEEKTQVPQQPDGDANVDPD